MSRIEVLPLHAAGYTVHAVHGGDTAWVEKNCYVDVWIEAIHALGLEPLAMLGFTVALDLEADQWTFFKPPHSELARLYGIDVRELNVWRGDLLEHARQHLAAGNWVFTEADAYWMPDTQGTDYRRQHTKSTIVINALDVEAQWLGYFHNAGYHELQGEDFVQLFRVGFAHDPAFLPLYAEFARLDRVVRHPPAELAAIAAGLLRGHLQRRPSANPLARFAGRFARDVEWLQAEGRASYHAYAFATLRQLGADFELAARHLEWLAAHGQPAASEAIAAFDEISSTTKALILKTARAVNTGKATDFAPMLEPMAAAWDRGMAAVGIAFGTADPASR